MASCEKISAVLLVANHSLSSSIDSFVAGRRIIRQSSSDEVVKPLVFD